MKAVSDRERGTECRQIRLRVRSWVAQSAELSAAR
jgi:hypothetical protein